MVGETSMWAQLSTLPNDWQATPGRVSPGDLTLFAPEGFGGAPLILQPTDTLESAFDRARYYGFEERAGSPIQRAPSTLAEGGTVYFDRYDAESGFSGVLRILNVPDRWKRYVIFTRQSEDTVSERYLTQMRLVSVAALSQLYGIAQDIVEALPEQPLTMADAVTAFLDEQTRYWSDDHFYSRKLAGSLGGDGDWAKERLAFGIGVENGYWNVYRVWSRPWLVTK